MKNVFLIRLLKTIFISIVTFCLLNGCVMKPDYQVINQARTDFQQADYKSAFNHLLPLARKGNSQAQYSVGYMYYYGLGVNEDTKKAHYWIEKAARNGNPNAIKALQIEKFHYASI